MKKRESQLLRIKTWSYARQFVVLLSLAFSLSAHSQIEAATSEIVTLSVEGTSKAANEAEAKKEITAWAIDTSSREQVIDLIGEGKYSKNKSIIEAKILEQSSRFIPVVNPGPISKEADGTYKMSVELRMNPASLRRLVLDAGLLNDTEGTLSILPMVSVIDRISAQSSRWWVTFDRAGGLSSTLENLVNERLSESLNKAGFNAIKPTANISQAVPLQLRVERPSFGEQRDIAQALKAGLVARGDLRVQSGKSAGIYDCSLKISVVNIKTERLIAEVNRQFSTDAGNFESVVKTKVTAELPEVIDDLVTQVQEAWLRGVVNASMVRVAFRGELSPQQEAGLQVALSKSLKEIKSISARAFQKGMTEYEIAFVGELGPLVERFKTAKLQGFDSHFTALEKGLESDTVVLEIKAK